MAVRPDCAPGLAHDRQQRTVSGTGSGWQEARRNYPRMATATWMMSRRSSANFTGSIQTEVTLGKTNRMSPEHLARSGGSERMPACQLPAGQPGGAAATAATRTGRPAATQASGAERSVAGLGRRRAVCRPVSPGMPHSSGAAAGPRLPQGHTLPASHFLSSVNLRRGSNQTRTTLWGPANSGNVEFVENR